MPKKNILIAGSAVILLLMVGIGLMMIFKSSKKSDDQTAVVPETKQEQSAVSTTNESIKSLFSAGKNVTCTVTYAENGGGGTMYIADKKMRGDFSTKVADGKLAESHMILDGDTSYSWMGTQGVKLKIDATAGASPAAGTTGQSADLDKQQEMNCSAWSVDNSKFTVPADIKFTDMTGVIQKTQTQTKTDTSASSVPSIVKSACETITDPAVKAACISAIQPSGN